jgi:excisionase family DNA binding protein
MADVSERSDPTEDPWLTVQQVSEELNINPATVRVWIRQERLRAVRAGKGFRVRRSELERALAAPASPAQVRVSSTAEPDTAVSPSPAPRRIADQIIAVAPAAGGAS